MIKFLCFFLFFGSYSFALTLKEIYLEAKNHNNSFKESLLNKDVLQQTKLQLKAVTLPTISLEASWTQLEQSQHYENAGKDDTREIVTLKGKQRLFSGLKDVYTLQSVDSLISAEEFNVKSKELDLLADVSEIYFNILLNQEKITNLQELISLSQDRQDLLKKRVRIGKSRKTELRQATVQTHSYQISLENTELMLKQAWNNLSVLVGKKLNQEKLKPYSDNSTLLSLKDYLEKIPNHPLIKAQEANVVAANKEKNSYQSEYFPSIDLTSNYYSRKAESTSITPEWDIGLSLSFPIFEGGLTRAKVASSALKEAIHITKLQQVKLALENEVKNTYQAIESSRKQQKLIEEMCADNKNNYEEIKKEYSIGLVNSLDVVTALNTYVESLNQKVANSIDLQMNLVQLKTLINEDI